MCGIVGAVAERNIIPVLMEGLRRLEYRGYDSAGLAALDEAGSMPPSRSAPATCSAFTTTSAPSASLPPRRPPSSRCLGRVARAMSTRPLMFAAPSRCPLERGPRERRARPGERDPPPGADCTPSVTGVRQRVRPPTVASRFPKA